MAEISPRMADVVALFIQIGAIILLCMQECEIIPVIRTEQGNSSLLEAVRDITRNPSAKGAMGSPELQATLGMRGRKGRKCACSSADAPDGDKLWGSLAEREGFEPSVRFWRTLTFQASAFDHSATAPHIAGEGALDLAARLRKFLLSYIIQLGLACRCGAISVGATGDRGKA